MLKKKKKRWTHCKSKCDFSPIKKSCPPQPQKRPMPPLFPCENVTCRRTTILPRFPQKPSAAKRHPKLRSHNRYDWLDLSNSIKKNYTYTFQPYYSNNKLHFVFLLQLWQCNVGKQVNKIDFFRPAKGRVTPNRRPKFSETRHPVTNYKMHRATYFEIFQGCLLALQTHLEN